MDKSAVKSALRENLQSTELVWLGGEPRLAAFLHVGFKPLTPEVGRWPEMSKH